MRRVVVVGASLAGLRAAQAVRRLGHDGELVVVGDEPHLPYDRPPLSKQLLDGTVTRAQLDLPIPAELGVQWRLGQPARGLDLSGRRIHLADGQHLGYDGLVLATGARARPWPGHAPPGVLTLRTADDAAALSAAMGGARRMLVVGAGFLGAADVAVVALGAQPTTDWLVGSGLLLDRGVVCDDRCRPLLLDGTAAPAVVAAGDVARWPHPLSDGLLSSGHWSNATEQAAAAAAALLRPDSAGPYRPVPSFWSDLHGVQIRSVGLPQQADDHQVVELDPNRRRLVVVANRRGQMVGAITANRTSRLATYRDALQQQLDSGLRRAVTA